MTVRWGVLATGGIAQRFAEDLSHVEGAELAAVGSRRMGAAERFATAYAASAGPSGQVRAHGSYESLVADPDIDAVYVATPHPGHHDAAMLAIEGGKAVLLEKPFTMDAAESRALVDAARARGTFLMEAMWTRFLPPVARLRQLVAEGAVGDVQVVLAENCQYFPHDAAHRLYAPVLGGGALLDLGIYPVSFVSMVLGRPRRVQASATPAFTGVDGTTSAILEHESGAHGVVTTTLSGRGPNRAAIIGSDGYLELDGTFFMTPAITLVRRDGEPEREEFSWEGAGLRFEAAEVGRCLEAGRLESDVMPLDETVSIMETLDEVRRQIGLDYSALR